MEDNRNHVLYFEKMGRALSIIILCFVYLFFLIVQYYQLPIGDDVLFRYKDSYYYYTLAEEWHPTDKISNITMMIDEIWNRWNLFSGRFSTVFLVPLMNVLGELGCAIVGAGIYFGIVVCIARIVFKSWKNILLHPFALLFIFVYQFALSSTGTYMVMWTFVCHYGMPTLLCLLYYIFWMSLMQQEHIQYKKIVLLNALGVLLGTSHELIPLFCFVLIGIRSLIIYKNKEKNLFGLCYFHFGLLIGYLFCVLAPGNFVRMGIDHDMLRLQTGIIEKMKISIRAHMEALGVYNNLSLLVLLVSIVLLIICIRKEGIKKYIGINIEFICICFISVILWGVVAPPVPQYGLQLWKAMLIICLLHNADIIKLLGKKYFLFTLISFIICICGNGVWCKDLISVTVQRRELIEQAHDDGANSVIVPKYPDSTNNYITGNNIANEGWRYYDEIYIKYYGLLVVPEE